VSQSFSIVAASTSSSGDVPLPPWAYVLLAAGLLAGMWRQRRSV
jgi:MYXO-CTERM domain-containing protein